MNDPLTLFLTFLRAAALSIGGQSSLPLLRQDLVTPGIVSERQVIEALAIGRLSTGPTGLYVVSLGYFAFGWAGALLAMLAATLPPLTIVPLASAMRKQLLSAWAAGIVRGVALTTAGLVVATGIQLLAPSADLLRVPLWQVALAAIATVLSVQGRIHPGILIGAGAAIGIAVGVTSGIPL